MKTQLTKEESQHLIDLGVPKEKATTLGPLYKREDGLWDYHRRFSILNLIEILPKEIGNRFCINIEWNFLTESWGVDYDYTDSSYFSAEELIDALYQLACWYYGEYLNTPNSGELKSEEK